MRISQNIYKTWTIKQLKKTLNDFESRIKEYKPGEYNAQYYRLHRMANDIKQTLKTNK